MFALSEAFVSVPTIGETSYTFFYRCGPHAFSVIGDRKTLDAYDIWCDANQPSSGRSKRLAALVAAPVLKALQNGERPISAIFRLNAGHFGSAFASTH
jgi:hypothetical protein